MKTPLNVLSLFLIAFCLVSCDTDKARVADAAKRFVQAAINNDKATIYELYPEIREYPNLHIANDLTDKNISVEITDSTTYIVNLNERMKLVMEVSDSSTIKIIDSFNVFLLDSLYNELAVKTGMPTTLFSDLSNGRFLHNNAYVPYLQDNFSGAMTGHLYDHDARILWGRKSYHEYVNLEIPVSNGGETMVKGEDYSVEIRYYTKSTQKCVGTSVEKGVDLAPGETFVFIFTQDGLYNYADNGNLIYDLDFHFKLSWVEMLVKYGNFSGREFNNYQKWVKKIYTEFGN